MAKVLIACECSGIVRDAFLARGHEAISLDLEPTERPGPHAILDVLTPGVLSYPWDLIIAHPPCTHLATSGARWFKDKQQEQAEALDFVRALFAAPCPRLCIENPVSVISTHIRKPDQTIQPWQFGHGEVKRTCLWLRGLPLLRPTKIVSGRVSRIHMTPERASRARDRSRSYTGIADAMASQWGALLMTNPASPPVSVPGRKTG